MTTSPNTNAADGGAPLNIPAYVPEDGIITSGLCAGEDAQNQFDERVAGHAPQDQGGPEGAG
jgi:hypothetical protein